MFVRRTRWDQTLAICSTGRGADDKKCRRREAEHNKGLTESCRDWNTKVDSRSKSKGVDQRAKRSVPHKNRKKEIWSRYVSQVV